MHLRYAVLLAACVLVAYVIALLLHGPRGYWLPMTVAFIYKPDFGPVLRRALYRCAGTFVGVAAIGAVAPLTGNSAGALVGTVAVSTSGSGDSPCGAGPAPARKAQVHGSVRTKMRHMR
ncbi:FUSC family protein [Streptomyces sp. NPDC029006]|uniref:FUSC family protein n=1 Tax=Streptomyces sp. NPDC029006 TaxID=3155467 RepID=UPI0034032BDA